MSALEQEAAERLAQAAKDIAEAYAIPLEEAVARLRSQLEPLGGLENDLLNWAYEALVAAIGERSVVTDVWRTEDWDFVEVTLANGDRWAVRISKLTGAVIEE